MNFFAKNNCVRTHTKNIPGRPSWKGLPGEIVVVFLLVFESLT